MASLLRNTAGQFFTFCLVSTTSTSGFPASTTTNTSTTGSPANRVFLRLYGDRQSSAVGAGTLTKLGGGQWAYAPTQTETNNIKFAFYYVVPNCVPVSLSFVTDIGVPTVSSSGALTVGTMSDKTGYSLTQSFPSNFSSLSISTAGGLTVGTNNDKTGYSLTQSFPANFSSLSITSSGGLSIANSFPTNFASLAIAGVPGALTVGTMNDKTGYSLTQAFPANFSSWAIDGSGQVTAGTVSDKTGYSLSQAFPSNFANTRISGTSGRVPITSNTQQGVKQTGPLTFTMTKAAVPTTGLKMVGQRVSNGLSLVNLTNSTGITEIGHGLYSITLSSNDLNSQGVMLRFTSTTTATSSTTAPVDDRPIWINPLP